LLSSFTFIETRPLYFNTKVPLKLECAQVLTAKVCCRAHW